jgi:hypothetical protein
MPGVCEPRLASVPVALEDPVGAEGDEDVVARDVDEGLGKQPILEGAAEDEDLLLVEEEAAVEALHAEEVPGLGPAEGPYGQRRRESHELVLVSHLQAASVTCNHERISPL